MFQAGALQEDHLIRISPTRLSQEYISIAKHLTALREDLREANVPPEADRIDISRPR